MRQGVIERRVLGAVRFIDATTGLRVASPLVVRAEGVRFVRNRSARYVIFSAPGLDAYAEAFLEPPAQPGQGSVAVELAVSDPSGSYLPRRRTIRLPLDPDPARAGLPGSLFDVPDIPLYPSPTAPTAPGWATIRATVTAAGTSNRLSGALIRVVRTSDAARLAAGLSDQRGEALVAVPGIPITTWDGGVGPVLGTELEVTLQTIFDDRATGEIPDPDALEAERATLKSSSTSERLASGRVLVTALTVPI
jgi:hypothetical protein